MQKLKTYLDDYVISRRWFLLVLYPVIAFWCIVSGYLSGHWWLSALNYFMAGVMVQCAVFVQMTPGLLKGWSEVERATFRAQMEQQIEQSLAEFKKAHPEVGADIQIRRVQ